MSSTKGDPVRNLIAGRATTDELGGFTVSIDPAEIPADYRSDLGHVDFELHLAVDDSEVMWNFSAGGAAVGGAGATTWGNPRVDAETSPAGSGIGPTHLSINFAEDDASIVELGNEPSTWLDDEGEVLGDEEAREVALVQVLPRDAGVEAASGIGIMAGPIWCATNTYRRQLAEQFARSVGTIQGKPYIHQTTSSSHTMGVAVNYKSSWSASGTRTKSTSASSYEHMGYFAFARNRVNYRLYAGCEVVQNQWRPHSFYSLNDHRVLTSRPQSWTHCSNVKKTGWAEKIQGTNATYSTGVKFPNIGLSADANFSSSTKIHWDFSGSGARLCGSTSKGWATAPQAGAYIPSWP